MRMITHEQELPLPQPSLLNREPLPPPQQEKSRMRMIIHEQELPPKILEGKALPPHPLSQPQPQLVAVKSLIIKCLQKIFTIQ
jgi:hypothetical protein